MKHAATRMLFSYWDTLRGERAAPERGEIEPGEIRHILADTFILELNKDRTADIRLAGTRLCALFGMELKAQRFAQLWPDQAAREVQRFTDIVTDETAGLVVGLSGTTDEQDVVDLEMILLPLRHRGRTHARALGAVSPATLPVWLGLRPVTRLATRSMRVIWPSGRGTGFGMVRGGEALEARRNFVVHRGGRA